MASIGGEGASVELVLWRIDEPRDRVRGDPAGGPRGDKFALRGDRVLEAGVRATTRPDDDRQLPLHRPAKPRRKLGGRSARGFLEPLGELAAHSHTALRVDTGEGVE